MAIKKGKTNIKDLEIKTQFQKQKLKEMFWNTKVILRNQNEMLKTERT